MSNIPDWATAHGEPLVNAVIRSTPSDFQVIEVSDIELSDDGEHNFLWVEKIGNNTQWVADRLARHAQVPSRDVGFAGMKDRNAVTRQWFSVRAPGETDWATMKDNGITVLGHRKHRRKLRRGAHRGNAFRIALRATGLERCRESVEQRLADIAERGVPNYFGEQRFGRDGQNIELSRQIFAGRRVSRAKRSIALSAARSLIFNSILDRRVQSGSWDCLLPGELANLDGSASVFAVAEVSDELADRCATQDIHPSASLWGVKSPRCSDAAAEIELQAAQAWPDMVAGIVAAGMDAASRALRLRVHDLRWELSDDVLWLEFELARGGYATAVLRELARF